MALPAANKLPERSQMGARHLTLTQPWSGAKTQARGLPSLVSSCSVMKTRDSYGSSPTIGESISMSSRTVAPTKLLMIAICPTMISSLLIHPWHGCLMWTRSTPSTT